MTNRLHIFLHIGPQKQERAEVRFAKSNRTLAKTVGRRRPPVDFLMNWSEGLKNEVSLAEDVW